MEKNLGHATAYGYAKSKGYSGTEEEFAQLMADYASVGQSAAQSAEQAAASATSASASAQTASQAAQTATSKASEAVTAAGTATTKASEASTSADTASAAATSASTSAQTATTKASTATTKASEAAASEAAALSAKTDAESARDAAAQSASEAAESARTLTIDATLTQSGQSADAKAVGDATGSIKDRLHIVDGLMWNNPDNFQVGNISISTSGWAYDTTYRKRVTTKEGVTIPLNIGDVIRLTDYSDARFYVGWRRKNGTYGQLGWNTSDFVCTEAGDYVINITNITEVDLQGDKFKLLNLLEVVRYSEIAFVRKERFYGNMYVPVEPGRIAISTSGWDYSPNAWYVRTKEHAVLNLCKGDVLGLKDFSKYSCFVGWRTSNGTYKTGGRWFDSAYTVTEDGAYVVCIRQGTGQTITDVDEALAQLYVSHTYNYHDIVDENETKMIVQSVVDNASISSFITGVNHRGFNTVAPENTLPAYKLSRLNGFRYAETDVAFTGDGIPVLLHDGTINRTARNADGTELSSTINIYDITYEQALEYDFGIWKREKYAGTKIPTFEQFIILCRNIGLHPYIELKTDGGYTEAQIAECVGIVKRYKMEEQSTFISFSATFLGYVKTAYPKARLGFLCNEITAENINHVKNLRTSDNNVFIDAANAYITDQSISLAANENIPVEVWTVNSKDTIIALNPYISGVTSDSIVASKVLSEYALED